MSAAVTDLGRGDVPSSEDVRAQLDKILNSQIFLQQKRRSAFLTYVVEETLAGRTRALKGVSIAMSVFDRDETFDQRVDPIVRLEARRLRSDLDSYYAGEGRWDPVRIALPKGGYVPSFARQVNHAAEVASLSDRPVSAREPAAAGAGRHLLLAGGLLLLLALAAGGFWFFYSADGPSARVAESGSDAFLALPRGPSIAVLPFLNLSGDSAKQYITDGFTEQLTTNLARFKELWVLPFGTAQLYKGGLADPQALQREFGIDYVLEGSVRTGGESIRITGRLVDAEGARYVWVRSFDAAFTPASLYDVQDAIAEEVAGNLAGEYGILAQSDLALSKRKAPDSLDAYDCVLRYYDYQKSISAVQHGAVKSCLERAVALEPDYAEAWAVLANVYMQEKRFWGSAEAGGSDVSAAKAKAAAERAIAIEPDNATAQMMLSNLLFTEGDLASFRQAGEAALRLNPNSSDALAHFGLRLGFIGEWDRGLALVNKAMALNPLHPDWYRFAPAIHGFNSGDFTAALAELEQIEMPQFFWVPLLRAATLGQLGRRDEAAAEVQALLALKPDFQQEGRRFMRIWQMPPTLVAQILEGLERAGLTIDPDSQS
ncbi:MAG TPA: tetratricopeptide repeat protein [Kiloniellaceae bacterium]|nr:tetratricopeptide repeat protein [Kiloniellaceae bacterium]